MSEFKLPKSKRSFVINSEHADMIVNDLLAGEYEMLGKIFTDLVNYNLYGDESLIESASEDRTDRTARRLLRYDSEQYITNWIAKSEQNAKNRTGGTEPSRDEIIDYARAKGYDEQIAIGWAIEQSHKDWKDRDGKPVKYWRKTLDAYMRAVGKKRIEDMTKGIIR